MSDFKYTRLYTGEDGKSYFEDIPIETQIDNPLGQLSHPTAVKNLIFRRSIPGSFDWHPAPQKQFIVYLSGEVEVEASGGESRKFTTGDILLAMDTNGKGHRSTVLTEGKAIIITLES